MDAEEYFKAEIIQEAMQKSGNTTAAPWTGLDCGGDQRYQCPAYVRDFLY